MGHDPLPLYALGALPDDERAAFEAHLRTCARCQQELADHGAALNELASVVERPPDDRLRAAVLDAVVSTPQETSAGDRSDGRSDGAPREAVVAPTRASTRSRRYAVAVAILAVAFLAATTTAALLWVRVVELERLTAGQPADVIDVLTADDARLVDLDTELSGTVRVAVAPSTDRGVVLGDDVQRPPSDRAYQLWLLDDGAPRSGGVLAGRDGVLATVSDIGDADAVAITVEPPSGSRAPTGPIVAEGTLDGDAEQD